MEAWQVSFIGVLVGLLGVLLGLHAGYKKWIYEKNREKKAKYTSERQEKYKELWVKVEEIHAYIRGGKLSSRDLDQHMHGLNAYLLASEIYLDEEDRALCNKYIENISSVNIGVKSTLDEDLNRDWSATAAFHPKVGLAIRGVQEMDETRSFLIKKIKKILTEEHAF